MGKIVIEGIDVPDSSLTAKARSQFWPIVFACLLTFVVSLVFMGLEDIQADVDKRVTLTAFEAEQRFNEASITMIRNEIKGIQVEVKEMGTATQVKLDELLRLLYVHNLDDSKKRKVAKQ